MRSLTCAVTTILLSAALLLSPALAGGPRAVNGLGEPMKWSTISSVTYHPDQGPLGQLDNAEARALLAQAFDVWADVGVVTFSEGALLPHDVDDAWPSSEPSSCCPSSEPMSSSTAFSLADKVALITGGGRGIGAGIARCFSDAGAAVVLVSRTAEQVEGVAAEIEASGGRAAALPADLTELSALPELVERAVAAFGGLDIVVNCAGGGDLWRPFLETRVEDLESAFIALIPSSLTI